MCGISAYYGNKNCEDILISFLEKLEYRGYDSTGIAVKSNGQIYLTKDYKITDLKQSIIDYHHGMGIGHTRWATHGSASKENAHPHYSNNKDWYVVHNGIIENYISLRQNLKEKGFSFYSETDSEVIPNILEHNNVNNIHGFIDSISKLTGSYAICAISKSLDKMYLARYKSPLYIANIGTETYVASDPICFDGISETYYSLGNNEFSEVSNMGIKFYDINHNEIHKKVETLNSKYTYTNKDIYSSFMEKEINEIPKVLNNILDEYLEFNYLKNIPNNIYDAKSITIIGCGTAYHSGLIGSTYLKDALNIPINVELASEFLCSNPIIDSNSAYIFVSQSGETADTLSALNMVKDKCMATIAITNVVYSTLARSVDVVLPVFAGPEIAVASTKAYSAQLLIFYLFATHLKFDRLSKYNIKKIKAEFTKLDISKLYYYHNLKSVLTDSIFILGKYTDYYTAMEASLKLREITYNNVSALPSGELKHGTLALISKDTTCFCISTKKHTLDKNLNAVHEIKARGGKVILVTNQNIENKGMFDYIISLPNIKEEMIDIISAIPFQLLALEICNDRGIDPDKPRNLAKSVTVE